MEKAFLETKPKRETSIFSRLEPELRERALVYLEDPRHREIKQQQLLNMIYANMEGKSLREAATRSESSTRAVQKAWKALGLKPNHRRKIPLNEEELKMIKKMYDEHRDEGKIAEGMHLNKQTIAKYVADVLHLRLRKLKEVTREQELEMLRLARQKKTKNQIAEALKLTEPTVRRHLKKLKQEAKTDKDIAQEELNRRIRETIKKYKNTMTAEDMAQIAGVTAHTMWAHLHKEASDFEIGMIKTRAYIHMVEDRLTAALQNPNSKKLRALSEVKPRRNKQENIGNGITQKPIPDRSAFKKTIRKSEPIIKEIVKNIEDEKKSESLSPRDIGFKDTKAYERYAGEPAKTMLKILYELDRADARDIADKAMLLGKHFTYSDIIREMRDLNRSMRWPILIEEYGKWRLDKEHAYVKAYAREVLKKA